MRRIPSRPLVALAAVAAIALGAFRANANPHIDLPNGRSIDAGQVTRESASVTQQTIQRYAGNPKVATLLGRLRALNNGGSAAIDPTHAFSNRVPFTINGANNLHTPMVTRETFVQVNTSGPWSGVLYICENALMPSIPSVRLLAQPSYWSDGKSYNEYLVDENGSVTETTDRGLNKSVLAARAVIEAQGSPNTANWVRATMNSRPGPLFNRMAPTLDPAAAGSNADLAAKISCHATVTAALSQASTTYEYSLTARTAAINNAANAAGNAQTGQILHDLQQLVHDVLDYLFHLLRDWLGGLFHSIFHL